MKTKIVVTLVIFALLFSGCKDDPVIEAKLATFTDSRDNHSYKYVKIGEQTWMAENLAYLPDVNPPSEQSDTDPCYYVYGFQGDGVGAAKINLNYSTFGVLYNWPAAKTGCPSGWHLPDDDEWMVLEQSLGMTEEASWASGAREWGEVGKQLKEAGTIHWTKPNTGTNSSEFTARPGGNHNAKPDFAQKGNCAYFWTSYGNSSGAWTREMWNDNSSVYRVSEDIRWGFSVRCVQN